MHTDYEGNDTVLGLSSQPPGVKKGTPFVLLAKNGRGDSTQGEPPDFDALKPRRPKSQSVVTLPGLQREPFDLREPLMGCMPQTRHLPDTRPAIGG